MRDYLFMHIHIGTLRVLGNLLSYCTLSHPKAWHNQEKQIRILLTSCCIVSKKSPPSPSPFIQGVSQKAYLATDKSGTYRRQIPDLPTTSPYFVRNKSPPYPPQPFIAMNNIYTFPYVFRVLFDDPPTPSPASFLHRRTAFSKRKEALVASGEKALRREKKTPQKALRRNN